jgi:hypothetical protein
MNLKTISGIHLFSLKMNYKFCIQYKDKQLDLF